MPLAYSSSVCSVAHPRPGCSKPRLHPSTQALQTTDASHGRISRSIRCGTTMFPKRLIGPLRDNGMCASPQKAVNGATPSSTFWTSVSHSLPKCVKEKRDHKLAPRSRSGVTSYGLLGAARSAGERLSREPAFASEIAPDVADLTTMVEVVKQDDGEPGPNFSGIATARRGEVPVEIRWGERGQAGQRLLPHRFSIPLQVGDGRFERSHLLQRIANATLGGIGRHVKLLVPASFNPHLWLAADIANNPVFHARGVPECPANGIALITRALGQIRI